MPLSIIRNDITKMQVDAIVNAANPTLLGGGGVDGAIHRAAGPELAAACSILGGCEPGQAKITSGFHLPCRWVIHTVGPVWQGGEHNERETLAACYRNSLALATEYNCETVAFPLISSGVYGYPKDQALRVAVDTISEFLADHDMPVTLVIFDRASFQIGEKLFADLEAYIDDTYVGNYDQWLEGERRRTELSQAADFTHPLANVPPSSAAPQKPEKKKLFGRKKKAKTQPAPSAASFAAAGAPLEDTGALSTERLDKALAQLDESFSQSLLRLIDEHGMTDAECYKKANIDRKLFSKIRSNPQYKPSKSTALAFAIALELPLSETNEFLRKAGFALSHSSKFDVIVEYFIQRGEYNIFEINEALFAFDQSLLGG